MSAALDLLICAVGWTHVLLAPYTKVEESFNLHATHDILLHGVLPPSLQNYDHRVFSGPVPRSFIGSLILAGISHPILLLASHFDLLTTKFDVQIVIRLVLATVNASTLILIRRAVSRRFGRATGLLFALLTCAQFHLLFWMGRTLPNMFALPLVNLSTYLLLDRAKNAQKPSTRSVTGAVSLLIFTAVVLRAEITLLLIGVSLQALLSQHISFRRFVGVGLLSALSSIALTVLVDSYFWGRWVWPEFSSIYFNIFQGKASDWGISPYHAYITSHLLKLLLSALPLSVFGYFGSQRARVAFFPSLLYILLISALGHKEWRFIIYVVPSLNVTAAVGARWLVGVRKGSLWGRLAFLFVAGALAANAFATLAVTRASMLNYPGGVALARFNEQYADASSVHVHISNLAAQTGASLFLHNHAPPYPSYLPHISTNWTYDKTEHLTLRDLGAARAVTHVIAEEKEWDKNVWEITAVVDGFAGLDVGGLRNVSALKERVENQGLLGVLGGFGVRTEERLWILERKTRK